MLPRPRLSPGLNAWLQRKREAFAATGRWTLRRLTPSGKLALAGYAATLLYVVNTRSTMNYQIFSFLLAALIVSFLAGQWQRVRPGTLTVQRLLPPRGTAGEPLAYELVIVNHGTRTQADCTVQESLEQVRGGDERSPGPSVAVRFLTPPTAMEPLAQGGRTTLRLSVTPPRRGILRFDPATLTIPEPLGLFRNLVHVGEPDSVLVLPRRFPVPSSRLPVGRRHQPGGVQLASFVGDSREFFALREYRHGDPMRLIHWKSWARLQKPIVKDHKDEFFARQALVLDTFSGQGQATGGASTVIEGAEGSQAAASSPEAREALEARFEAAVSVAASLATMDRDADSLLDLLFVADQARVFTAGRGLARTEQMLEVLAQVELCADKSFEVLSRVVMSHARSFSSCLLVLLDWDAPRQELVRGLRERGVDPLTLVLVEPGKTLAPGPLADRPGLFRPLAQDRLAEELARL